MLDAFLNGASFRIVWLDVVQGFAKYNFHAVSLKPFEILPLLELAFDTRGTDLQGVMAEQKVLRIQDGCRGL